MYGGWMCIPPMEMLDMYYVDCMRFLPGADYSNQQDITFDDGPIRVMTYMSSRNGTDTTTVDGNDRLVQSGDSVGFQNFTVDLSQFADSGAISSISAVGFATACLAFLSF